MTLDGVSVTETYDKTAGSVEQDQPSNTCSLIMFYTPRNINR